jgi:ethanolamine utilization microcompartment shell protein EutS
MAKTKKQEPKKTEIILSELVSGKLKKLQQLKAQADKEITDLIDIVLAEKASDIKPGTKITISPDFKKISF